MFLSMLQASKTRVNGISVKMYETCRNIVTSTTMYVLSNSHARSDAWQINGVDPYNDQE